MLAARTSRRPSGRQLIAWSAGLGSAVVLASCGGSSSSSTSSAAPTTSASTAAATAATPKSAVSLAADPGGQLKFDTSSLSAKAGTVTISMKNPSSVPHAIAVEGSGVDKDGKIVTSGGTSTVKLKLKPGTYTFYCPVPGHRAAGMQGRLTVR